MIPRPFSFFLSVFLLNKQSDNSFLFLQKIKISTKSLNKAVYRDLCVVFSSTGISEAVLSRLHFEELSVHFPRASLPPEGKLWTHSPGWAAAWLHSSLSTGLSTGSLWSFSQLCAETVSRSLGTSWRPRSTVESQVEAIETSSRCCLRTGCTWQAPPRVLSPLSDSGSSPVSARFPQSVRYWSGRLLGPSRCSRSHTCWNAWLLSLYIARLPYCGLHNYVTGSPRHWDSDRRMSSQNRSSFVDSSTVCLL